MILNLINSEESDIKYTLSTFPDGEPQITLGEFSRKELICVKCRVCNPHELFILCQVMDIFDRHEIVYDVNIYYLMGMRMDRVMDFNRPFTLKVVGNIINSYKFRYCNIYDLHSDRITTLYDRFYNESCIYNTERISCGYQIVAPDRGAVLRYPRSYYSIICNKERDPKTGKLNKFIIKNPEDISDKPLIIIDDLCDRGGTFMGIAEAIRKVKPDAKIDIYVTHVVNKEGIYNLAKTFNHVYITNSYCDWKTGFEVNGEKFPDNITQIDVIHNEI